MIIFRYLFKEVFGTLLIATMILMVLFVTNQSVQFLQRASTGEIPATDVLGLIVLQIPLMLGYLLPLGLYLGVLLTFGRMYLESEMTVLFACGFSRAKLTTMVLMMALVIASIVAWLMASVVPKAQGDINTIFGTAAVTASVSKVIPGQFMTFGRGDNQVVFYAKSVADHAVMRDVFLAQEARATSQCSNLQHPNTNDFHEKNSNKWSILVAKSAQEKKLYEGSGRYLIFEEGNRYIGAPGDQAYQSVKFNEYGVRLTVDQIPTYNAVQYYSISKLWSLYDKDKNAAAELQWRLALPLSALIFALLAVPLGEVRPRYGKFTQLFPAMLIYVTYADLIFLTRAWIGSGKLSTTLGMWWVHGAALLIAMLLMAYRAGLYRGTRNKVGVEARAI